MSLPRELLEDLLSRYMDGSLSDDERRRVEQILATDESARVALSALEKQATLLRALHRSSPKLDRRFAQRVVDSAIDRAIQQELPETHPLRLADPNRDARRTPDKRSVFQRRRIWISVAVAASLAFAVFTIRSYSPERSQLAESAPRETVDGNQAFPTENPATDSVLAQNSGDHASQPNRSAINDERNIASVAERSEETSSSDSIDSVASVNPIDTQAPPADRVAMANVDSQSDSASPDANGGTEIALPPSALNSLRMLMVYEIEVTALGRERNVVGRVFQKAGIVQGDRRSIDEKLVGFLKKENLLGSTESQSPDSQDEVGMLLLEGSGIKLDRLMTDFYMAREEISKVGFQLATGAPLSVSEEDSGQSSPSPTKSERNGDQSRRTNRVAPGTQEGQMVMARQLVREGLEGDASETFSAGPTRFVPWTPEGSSTLGGALSSAATDIASPSQTPDITAQVLLIIRQAP